MEALFTAITIPAWAVAIGALAVVLVIISLFRSSSGHESHGSLGVLTQLALVVVIGGAAYLGLRQVEDSAKRAERQAFESRAAALLARAAQPGSVLACLDGASDPALAEACERTLFAEPQRVAAALSHVRERLLFVADAVAYAEARDATYLDRIKELRDDLEGDAYGFVAHVLATEDKCTPNSCARFRFLRDLSKVRENLEAKRLEALVAKHAAAWREPEKPPVQKSEAPAPMPSTAAATPATEPESGDKTVATPPAATPAAAPAATPAATAPAPASPARSSAKQKQKEKDKAAPRAGRRVPEPVAGLPRVVPRRYLEPEEEEPPPTPARAPGTPSQPAASTLPPPTSITPPRQN
jgi:hypothetical protein